MSKFLLVSFSSLGFCHDFSLDRSVDVPLYGILYYVTRLVMPIYEGNLHKPSP